MPCFALLSVNLARHGEYCKCMIARWRLAVLSPLVCVWRVRGGAVVLAEYLAAWNFVERHLVSDWQQPGAPEKMYTLCGWHGPP